MIKGIGIDTEVIERMAQAYKRHPKIVQRILTDRELAKFYSYTQARQMEYLTGRWAAKEAFAKAYGTGIAKIGLTNMEILNDATGAPIFTRHPFEFGRVHVSISHTADIATAFVILEEENAK